MDRKRLSVHFRMFFAFFRSPDSAWPAAETIAQSASRAQIEVMGARRKKKMPLIRQGLFLLGCLLIIAAPLVGAIPGPGGVFVFAAGLALVLQNSEWAKRQYVKFKRKHPNKGRWADWGMRRSSARRREEVRKQSEAADAPVSD